MHNFKSKTWAPLLLPSQSSSTETTKVTLLLNPLVICCNFILYRQTQCVCVCVCVCVFKNVFIYLLVCWVFAAMHRLSRVAACGATLLMRCSGFSLQRLLLPQQKGSVVVGHRLSCSAACGIFPDQGLNPCPLHSQEDSSPSDHQGSPKCVFSEFS